MALQDAPADGRPFGVRRDRRLSAQARPGRADRVVELVYTRLVYLAFLLQLKPAVHAGQCGTVGSDVMSG